MSKGVVITILVIVGIVIAVGLVMSAVLQLAQAAIGVAVWLVILGAAYFFIKSKVD